MSDSPRGVYEQWLLGMWHAPDDELDERAAALAAADMVAHDGRRTMHERGPVALATIVRQARVVFTDARVSLDVGPIVDGDLVAARWSFVGRYAGGIPGANAPEGTEATLVGADTMRVTDGRIHEYWALSDGADLMSQLTDA